jgi:stress-induced morphogen
MLLTCEQVAQMIRDGIPGAEVTVADMTGTSDHFDATVVAGEFVGKSLVQQHQLVYAALGDAMKGPVHALKLNTKTP